MFELNRRTFLRGAVAAAATVTLGSDRPAHGDRPPASSASPESNIQFTGCSDVEAALRIAAAIYPKNRRKDALSPLQARRVAVTTWSTQAGYCWRQVAV